MDPLSITAAAGGLTGTILTLTKTIGAFVGTARNSRVKLDAVSRELISLQVCLDVFESDRRQGIYLNDRLKTSVGQILVNVQLCCGQIRNLLTRCETSRLGRPIKWAIQQKDEVNRLRASLETHKTALQITLQLNTVSLLIRETRAQPNTRTLTNQDRSDYITIQRIGQRVEDIAQSQNQGPALQRIEDVMTELSAIVKDIACNYPAIKSLLVEGCTFAAETLATVTHLKGVREIETKIHAITENPFIDPFTTHDPMLTGIKHSRYPPLDLKIAFCPIYPKPLTDTDASDT